MYRCVFLVTGAALVVGIVGCASDGGRRTSQPFAPGETPPTVARSESVPETPAYGDEAPIGLSGTRVPAERITDEQLRDYGFALNGISGVAPDVARAIREGEPVGASLVDKHLAKPEAREAIADAGLSEEEFRTIARSVEQEESLRERYRHVAQQIAQPPVSPPSTVPEAPWGNISGEPGVGD